MRSLSQFLSYLIWPPLDLRSLFHFRLLLPLNLRKIFQICASSVLRLFSQLLGGAE
jgi:hypothetical protein